MYLDKINDVKDVKKIDLNKLSILSDEVRQAIINRVSKVGGHIGPNLGVVELTVALHYVFNSPFDKIVFDVSHQCYAHKILTGRKEAFLDDDHFHDVTGFTNPEESKHDIFKIGHTSTSISLALGLALERDLKKTNENVIAVIGDGSLTGGEALEALNYAGEYKGNLIIIVNDNNQSIAENHGGIYKNLKLLRENNGKCDNNFFESCGFEYHYLDDGNDVLKLVKLFKSIKNVDYPVVLHIHTIKGKGLKFAQEKKEIYHSGGPFDVVSGKYKFLPKQDDTVFDSLKNLLDSDDRAIVVNAATPTVLGFTYDKRKKYVESGQFVDVGIAEENAVAVAGGIAREGGTAVFGTTTTFMQRVYDQVSHDVCLNNLPVTFLLLRGGVYGMNSDTHLGLCDIQLFAHIPNLIYVSPSTRGEYINALKFATSQKNHPVGIRVPAKFSDIKDDKFSLNNKVLLKGEGVAIFGVGKMIDMAMAVATRLKKDNISVTVINPLVLSNLDASLLNELKLKHKLVITLEDGELFGGYGSNIASFYGNDNMKVLNFGISKKFHTDFDPDELLEECGMSVSNICNVIYKFLNSKSD